MKRYRVQILFCFAVLASILVLNHVLVQTSRSAFAASVMGPDTQERVIKRKTERQRYLVQAFAKDTDEILKASGQDILLMFDKPELVREEQPTTVWQYRTASCTLDVYFVSDTKDPLNASVAHYEIRARHDEIPEGEDIRGLCLYDFMQSHNLLQTAQAQGA